jgi:type II secretory pathway predicted ATPase ExeA
MSQTNHSYMPMAIDGLTGTVRYTCPPGAEPLVDLRSLFEALRMKWLTWEARMLVICSQRGWQPHIAKDFQGRKTQLLAASSVAHLLSALAVSPLACRHATKSKLTACAHMWDRNWERLAIGTARGRVMGPLTHGEAQGHTCVLKSVAEASNGITPTTEFEVLKLTADGRTPTQIAKELGLNRSTVSLLARGKYKFAKKLASGISNTPEAVSSTPTVTEEKEDPMLLQNQALNPEARQHFKLPRNPFVDDVQSPDDVFQTPSVRYVRAALLDCAQHHGFVAVVGESGAGKSTLAEDLEERIKADKREVLVVRPYVLAMEANDQKGKTLKSGAIAEAIAFALDPHISLRSSPQARFQQVHDLLKASRRAGRRHLLLIEEAHCLPLATLKHLKRFLELKDGMQRLIGVALIGQPELRERLGSQNAEVREVAQRCEIVALDPLDGELEAYLQHKFARFDLKLSDVFAPDAFDAMRARLIHTPRGGRPADARSLCYPLVVNNLVCRAMNAAAAAHWPQVDAQVVKGC